MAAAVWSAAGLPRFPPLLAPGTHGERRVRRFVRGETTQRSDLDPDALIADLREVALARLRDAKALWLILDGSDLRKPHAQQMEALQPVLPLTGKRTVPGYPTLTMLGLGGDGRRGILDHRLYSRNADDFVSQPSLVRQVITSTGETLASWAQPVTLILDRGFDDQAILATGWRQGWHLVWRVRHQERKVRAEVDGPLLPLDVLGARDLTPIGSLAAEMLVQKRGQARPKRQPVTVRLRTCPVQVPITYLPEPGDPEERWEQPCWLVEARLVGTAQEPWWLLTDHPVTTDADAVTIFRMYAQRWAIEDTFKVVKETLGQETVQVLGYEAVRTLDALAWVALAYLEELGTTLDHAAIRFLRRLGGGEDRRNRPVGRAVLLRGLQRLLDLLVTAELLAAADTQGTLPPGIAALLGLAPDDP